MRLLRRIALAAVLLLPTVALAQTIDTPKLKGSTVLEGASENAPKLNGWAVLRNDVFIDTPKLNGWAILTGVNFGAPGGGGGGAAGLFGDGEDGNNGSFFEVGYGGAGDATIGGARQNTPGAAGNAGTEYGSSGIGSGSGGAGGNYNGIGTGQAGGVGGTYGGGGGGGGAGSSAGGAGALGGEGVIWISYGGNNIILTKDTGSTWTVPLDWSNTNSIVILGPGGCGSAGAILFGGTGGAGGDAIGGDNINLFTPGQIVPVDITSAADACAGVPSHTQLNGVQAGGGVNGDGTGGGETIPIPPSGGDNLFDTDPGDGGNGGNLLPPPTGTGGHILYRAPLTRWW